MGDPFSANVRPVALTLLTVLIGVLGWSSLVTSNTMMSLAFVVVTETDPELVFEK